MGLYDDLIPTRLAARPTTGAQIDRNPDAPPASAATGGLYDDLIPTKGATSAVDDGAIDNTGAPFATRLKVGSSPAQDRLANIQQDFPDAQPYGDDNFVFTSPETGKQTIYNPPGFDLGDIPSVAREGSQFVGAGLAGTAAALGSIPTGGLAAPVGVPLAAGAGSAAAGQAFDFLMQNLGGQINTRTAGERTMDAATDVGMEGAGSGLGSLFGKALKGVKSTAGGMVKKFLGGDEAETATRLADLETTGVTPTAGLVSEQRVTHGTESALSNVPSAANVMQTSAERTGRELDAKMTDLATRIGGGVAPVSKETAGEALQTGAEKGAQAIKTRDQVMYDSAFSRIGRTTPVQLSAVQKLQAQMQADLAKAPESFSGSVGKAVSRVDAILKDAQTTGAIDFDTLRRLRTEVGRDLDDPVLVGSTGKYNDQLKRLYGALTEDMKAAAAKDPVAARTLRQADLLVQHSRETAVPLLQKITDSGTGESAFNYAMAGAKDGGTKLRILKQNIPSKEWDAVAGSVLGRMGRARPSGQDASGEAFSATTFLTNWNQLSKEARAELFGGTRYQGLQNELDALVRSVGYAKDIDRMANTSGTARNLVYMQLLGAGVAGAVTNPATTVATVVGPWAVAKLMTNPSFARWLTTAVKSPEVSPNGISAQMGRLFTIARENPDIAGAVEEYANALRTATGGQPQE